MNLRSLEDAIKNRRNVQPMEEEKVSEKEITEYEEMRRQTGKIDYQKIDFFLSARSSNIRPEHSLQEIQEYIISALQDRRRDSMLYWLQMKFNSSYTIDEIPDITKFPTSDGKPDGKNFPEILPQSQKWKLIYHEESGAHSWQISPDGYWEDAGDISDVAIQIYENGYVIMATGMNVRAFRL